MGGTGGGLTSAKGVQEAVAARRMAATAAASAVALLLCLAVVLVQQTGSGSPLMRYLVRSGWPVSQPDSGGSRGRAAAGAQQLHPALPPPPPYCAFNTQLPREEVRWSTANGTADQLSVRGCSLRRFSHAEAKQCLAGKRLVFVGDSVTRYQYLTLLHFLDRGRWPAPLGGVPGDPSVANEKEWPSWNDFLRGSNALFGGRELCDCFRAEYDPLKEVKPPESEKHENRYYTSPDGIFVSHLTYTTFPNKLHGHFGFPPYPHARQPCAPATCDFPEDWAHHLAEGLAGPVKEMRPTHLVVNSGLWGSSNQFEQWPAIAAAGRAAVAAQGGRAIWKTTTGSRGKFPTEAGHDAMAIEHTQAAGWDLLDAFNITRPITFMKPRAMWDGRHFKAVVYRELNLYLLNMICQPDGGTSGTSNGSSSGSSGGGDGSIPERQSDG